VATVATPPRPGGALRHWIRAMRHAMEARGIGPREAFELCADAIARGRCRSEEPGSRGAKLGLLLEAYLEIVETTQCGKIKPY
jgi:hypothetical protein